MKRQLSLAIAGILLLTVTACMPAQMDDRAMNNESTMAEKSMDDTKMAESEVMTDTMMDESTVMTDTMMNESHAMTDTMMDESAVTTDTMMDESHAMTETEAMTGEAMQDESMMALPAWMTLPLVNARSGESMTLADLKGKTVFVETMATWCPNCRTQLGNVKAAHAQNSDPNTVFIAISVETDLAADQLAQYADTNGFDWFFAVSSPELLVELVNTFGQTIANPPATPHFVINADGTVGPLVTGFEDGDQILAALQG